MKPEAQPRHRQDSQRDKDALGRTTPKGDGAGSASPHEGFSGSPADAGQVNHPTTDENAPAAPCGAGRGGVVWKLHSDAGRVVREPSFVTWWAGTVSVEDGTHSHNLPQQAPACSPALCPSRRGAGRADPAQPVRLSWRGAKHRAAGMGRKVDPLKASKARSAAGA